MLKLCFLRYKITIKLLNYTLIGDFFELKQLKNDNIG